jgi:DNA-binding XRE family transcriptional regulator
MHMSTDRDDLDELIDEWARDDPDLPRASDALAEAARLMVRLAERRRALGLTQVEAARRLHVSVSALGRLERGEADPRLSTLARYVAIVGGTVQLDERDVTRPGLRVAVD